MLPQDSSLLRPCLAHPDLHGENIYVNPSNPSEITANPDWSFAEIAPLLVQTRQPHIIDYDGAQPKGLERPIEFSDHDSKSDAEARWSMFIYLGQNLLAFYRKMIHGRNTLLWKCLEYQETPHYELLAVARGLLREGEAPYLAEIVKLIESGSEITALSHTIDEASQARREALLADKQSIQEYMETTEDGAVVMERIEQTLGDLFPERGLVRHEEYDESKYALGQIKEKVIEKFARSEEDKIAWEQSWHFDD